MEILDSGRGSGSVAPMDARLILRDLARITGPRAVVAFSGGMDSGLLARALLDAGVQVTLATVVGPHISTRARTVAMFGASSLNLPQVIHELCPVSDETLAVNDELRCYYCKQNVFSLLKPRSGAVLCDGTTADDDPERPGRRAAVEAGVVSPLEKLGLTKKEVSALARELRSPGWDVEPDSCLATRVRTGTRLTAARLELVEAVEALLHSEDVTGVRARLDDMMMSVRYSNENGPLSNDLRRRAHELCRAAGMSAPEFVPW
ncbi:ATP-dependent sacrificial sulfur transferase LarE [Salidesulfovibrio brasiliensis]|uniref:TIGR00268 family protein n=1 Tax=Salidesulfovibrio brasiliensis TaxID=221711 RepID=UPI0012ED2632|nr:TIGR00268 family protein [Salidesulfovibrio brasiliensis]